MVGPIEEAVEKAKQLAGQDGVDATEEAAAAESEAETAAAAAA